MWKTKYTNFCDKIRISFTKYKLLMINLSNLALVMEFVFGFPSWYSTHCLSLSTLFHDSSCFGLCVLWCGPLTDFSVTLDILQNKTSHSHSPISLINSFKHTSKVKSREAVKRRGLFLFVDSTLLHQPDYPIVGLWILFTC